MYYTACMADTSPTRSAKRSEGLLTVDLGPRLKADWTCWCAERGLVPGRALRTLAERTMTEGMASCAGVRGARAVATVLPAGDEGRKVRREIGFTPTEDRAIGAAAQAQGLGYHEWVIAAVRGALAQAPTYGQAELEVLTASNVRLIDLVRHLAEWRRSESEGQLIEWIGHLETQIRTHIEAASAAMAQGARRWQIKM